MIGTNRERESGKSTVAERLDDDDDDDDNIYIYIYDRNMWKVG